ncbi:hypothetical protein GCM10027425_30570 [Alteromonas gracilis]
MADSTEPRDSDMTAPIGRSEPTPPAPDASAAAAGSPDSTDAPAQRPVHAPIPASGTTPPPVETGASGSGRGWRHRVRRAGRTTLLGGAAAALVLLLLGGVGGFAIARVVDDGAVRGPGIGWHDRDGDDERGRGGMLGPGGGPGQMLPPGTREEESEGDSDSDPTT